tara:strand:+ start:847 stop:1311 length:465 start_codon:yes stop_codon:yes gene_type:complete
MIAADDEPPAPASAAPASSMASTGSPGTGYALSPPLNVLQPEEPGERLQRQVRQALAAGGDEARRRLVALAFEIMPPLPSEFLADRLDRKLGAMDSDDIVGVTGRAAEERPPSHASPTPSRAPRTPLTMQVSLTPVRPGAAVDPHVSTPEVLLL